MKRFIIIIALVLTACMGRDWDVPTCPDDYTIDRGGFGSNTVCIADDGSGWIYPEWKPTSEVRS